MRRLVCLLALVAGCGLLDSAEDCCTVTYLTKPLSGEVRPPTDIGVPGVRVYTESAEDVDGSTTTICGQPGRTLVRTETLAQANGQFQTVVRWPAGPACARIWAQTQGSTPDLVSDTIIYPLDPATAGAAVSDLVLQLRANPSP